MFGARAATKDDGGGEKDGRAARDPASEIGSILP